MRSVLYTLALLGAVLLATSCKKNEKDNKGLLLLLLQSPPQNNLFVKIPKGVAR